MFAGKIALKALVLMSCFSVSAISCNDDRPPKKPLPDASRDTPQGGGGGTDARTDGGDASGDSTRGDASGDQSRDGVDGAATDGTGPIDGLGPDASTAADGPADAMVDQPSAEDATQG